MEQITIDCHLHSTCSDGVLRPDDLFAAVRRLGLSYFSITDHDTMTAYPVPADLRDRCIRGMEVDSELLGHTVHLLAYGVDPLSPLVVMLDRQRDERLGRMHHIVEKLRYLGHSIDLADVLQQAGSAASVGRPHLARALVARGIVPDIQAAFDRFLADGGSAFVPLKRLSSEQIIDLIHESTAVAVVAHPKRLRDPADLTDLIAAGVDGIEIVHPTATNDDQNNLAALAAAHDLITTGGTDFHAPEFEDVRLGVAFDARAIERLIEAIAVAI